MGPTEVRRLLGSHWDLGEVVGVEPLLGGMNSHTWSVTGPAGRFVLKQVSPQAKESFVTGLTCAQSLAASGVSAGAPLPARLGELVVDAPGGPAALLRWVEGTPLTGDEPADGASIGRTLALVHAQLAELPVLTAQPWHWVDATADHLDVEPWVRHAVSGVVDELADVRPGALTTGLLHADPAPEAFLLDHRTGRCGLIDWAGALRGPLLYDLASAQMYLGGPGQAEPLLEAYTASGVLPVAEIEEHLDLFARFRWAVQADYFAWRIRSDYRVGLVDSSDNAGGLADARRALQGA